MQTRFFKTSITIRRQVQAFQVAIIFYCSLASGQSLSNQVTIASPISIPPYVFSGSDTGIQLDIVRESLISAGLTLKVIYASNNRGLDLLKTHYADGMINAPEGIPGLYYSEPLIEFLNGVVALKSRNLKLEQVSDLQPLRVVGFQNASNYFGRNFNTMSQTNKHYTEVVNQFAQINMLFQKRCDAIVIDQRIFNFYLKHYQEDGAGFNQDTLFYNILPPSPRYIAFHEQSLRDLFNKGLQQLKSSGRLQEIITSYLN
ncbi:substrate-binding periplasmic protein [Alkalimarinus alittae]|uniref:Transporter substrate-binding domain-containing protein n=1 Tax=Alkalimarinus alittae TaxID=2961619 RepID=A0ABY6MYV0_9ALTE|nr:transporter substrate-binding domain-containing protein [Alkalimarinus alittae]UZE95016.1 transporter substrate-binding domain-containing protein [Alkalimarinus alittae]